MSTLGAKNPTLLVILPNPSLNDGDFRDFPAQWLVKKFLEIGLENYAITYMVKCRIPDDKKPAKRNADACLANLAEYLELNEVSVIAPVGSMPLASLAPGVKLTETMGDVLNTDSGNLFPLMNPAAMKHDPRKETMAILQVRSLKSYIDGTQFKTPPVKYSFLPSLPEEYLNDHASLMSIDIETTGLDPKSDYIRCTSFTKRTGESICVEHPTKSSSGMPMGFWENTKFLAHNAKFESRMIREWWGIEPVIEHDTQMQHMLLKEEEMHHLDTLSRIYTSIGGFKDESVDWLRRNNNDWSKMPMSILSKRNCGDTDATLRIHKMLYPEIQKEGLEWLYKNVAVPVQFVTSRLEERGLYINTDTLNKIKESEKKSAEEKLALVCQKYEIPSLNFRSPPQMRNLIFEKMGLKPVKETKSGEDSTDSEAIELMVDSAVGETKEYLKYIVDARSNLYNVSKSDEILKNIRQDGTVSSDLRYTVTFRYTSSNPNLQNLPTDGIIKKAVESRFTGGKIIEADYSQLELRLIGAVSGCRELINCYKNNIDVHQRTSDRFGVERNKAKRINFAAAYGVGSKKLSRELKCSVKEAKEFLTEQSKLWWEIGAWRGRMAEFARVNGYVKNLMGMKRRLPNIHSKENNLRIDAELQSGNFPIQSLGACTCMYAMCLMENFMHTRKLPSNPIKDKYESIIMLQIHDSILIDYSPSDDIESIYKMLRYFMVDAPMKVVDYAIPLDIEIKTKDTWGGNYAS